ncbi:MAG TPA: hypothetical protein VNT79_16940 [Phycisphaerae bacterium]|nr:hypothetical protein [Phycisphaerae bacterium]
MKDEGLVRKIAATAKREFELTNKKRLQQDQLPIANGELEALRRVTEINPVHIGVVDAVDNWVIETRKDSARAPNDDEWRRFLSSPLDGMIGMSLALQWRYNFGTLFGVKVRDEDEDDA